MKTLADKLKKIENDFYLFNNTNTSVKSWDLIYKQSLKKIIALFDGTVQTYQFCLRTQENLFMHIEDQLDRF
jgi:hypothetical protein